MKLVTFLSALLLISSCSHGSEQRYTPTVQKSMNSVVKITSKYIEAKRDPKTKKITFEMHQAVGSGVIISTNGHILTCEHVVSGSPFMIDVQLKTSTTTHLDATVLRRSFNRDIALLKLTNYSTATIPVPLAKAMPRVGDEVIAIGHPLGFDWTATVGIISGLNREGLAVNLLQTDAPINFGNSGGPLFDLDGEVIGINESGLMLANSIGFAVSIDEIRKFLDVFKGLEQAY